MGIKNGSHTVGYFTNEAREKKWGLFGGERQKERNIGLPDLSVEVERAIKDEN